MNNIDDILERLKGQQPVISDPDALTDRIMNGLEAASKDKRRHTLTLVRESQPKARSMHLWRNLSIAASILFKIGIGITLTLTDWQEPNSSSAVAEAAPQAEAVRQLRTISPKASDSQSEGVGLPVRGCRTVAKAVEPSQQEREAVKESRQVMTPKSMSNPSYHYASQELTKDTLPYQDPSRVDEFVAKMAAYHQVQEGELTCSASMDSTMASTVYVFPDNKETDVFGRLLQVACWYSDETPGYLLSFSHQQFFFELKDMRQQLQYRWIAERVNGKILLYGTHAPLGTKESSACYQEYRDELMHTRSINKKPKEI